MGQAVHSTTLRGHYVCQCLCEWSSVRLCSVALTSVGELSLAGGRACSLGSSVPWWKVPGLWHQIDLSLNPNPITCYRL